MVERFLSEEVNVSYCARKVTGTEYDEYLGTLRSNESSTVAVRAAGSSVDVSSKEALTAWVAQAHKTFGRIDAVIANASPVSMEGTTEAWTLGFGVDMMGFVELAAACAPHLEKSPLASITVVSSFMGREFYRSPPAAYGAFKAAQLQHVQELSHFLGPRGIRVNALSPGPILAKGGSWEKALEAMPDWVEEQRLKVPLRRLGTPQEMANVAVFLASPLASYVSGANLLADGGIHMGTSF